MATPYTHLTPDQIEDALVKLLKGYRRSRDTALLARAAIYIVELRARNYLQADGMPDWAGRSAAYRDTYADLYTRADIPKNERGPIQSSLRYHVGNALREYAPSYELAAAGLQTTSPKDRVRAERDAAEALQRQTFNADNPLELAQSALRLLDRIDPNAAIADEYVPLHRTLIGVLSRTNRLIDTV